MAILIGTILLSLPIATVSHETDVVTALFTATTSICVTGLVVVDTYSYWSLFGKIVILCLIQVGGLGIIAIMSTALLIMGKKVSLRTKMRLHDSFGLDHMQGLIPFLKKVMLGTLSIELLGAIIYMPPFFQRYGIVGIWYALFNSISAFCNAGIDIMGPDSLVSFQSSPCVLINSMFLIIMGGLGFVVWWDIFDALKKVKQREILLKDFFRRLNTHSKVVLTTTLFLILSAMLFTFFLEYNNDDTLGKMSLFDKLMNSLFQSVTLRTAGFASIDQGSLKEPTIIISILYMMIGGSPVGTAGGIKTVSAAVLAATVISVCAGRTEITIFRRRVENALVRRALSVAIISGMIFILFSVLLMVTNNVSITDAIFEVASAIATVGLSRGITSSLNVVGKMIIIITMYLGRIGPISLFIVFSNRYADGNSLQHGKADLIVG